MDEGAWWATVYSVAKSDTTEPLHSLTHSKTQPPQQIEHTQVHVGPKGPVLPNLKD